MPGPKNKTEEIILSIGQKCETFGKQTHRKSRRNVRI